jgi:hypothetical protein
MDESQSGKEQEPVRPPEWLKQMWAHYRATGCVRTEDLRRILGDPAKPIEMPFAPGEHCAANQPLFG